MALALPAALDFEVWPAASPDSGLKPAGWQDLPAELVWKCAAAAHAAAAAAAPPHVTAELQPVALPTLAQAARLAHALDGSCRAWRAAAALEPIPQRLSLGRSPLPPTLATAAARLRQWLARRPLAALHLTTSSRLPGCSPYHMQQLAIELLASAEVQRASGACCCVSAAGCAKPGATCIQPKCQHSPAPHCSPLLHSPAPAGGTLAELALLDYVASRPLCALLPRFPALRSLTLSGYCIDLDLAPLCLLPQLRQLSLQSEALPSLANLPPGLRSLSLSCFAHAAR